MPNTHALELEETSSQYASIADVSQTGLGIALDFVLEAWIQLESNPATGFEYTIMGKWTAQSDQRSYLLELDQFGAAQQALEVLITGDGTANDNLDRVSQQLAIGNIPLGEWHHVAVACDLSQPVATKFFFFYDGVFEGNGDTIISSDVVTSIFNSTSAFAIGARFDGAGAAFNFFDGKIDNARVWSCFRNAATIKNERAFQMRGDEAFLEGCYLFNNDLLDTGHVSSRNGNDLTGSGAPTFDTDPAFTGPTTWPKFYARIAWESQWNDRCPEWTYIAHPQTGASAVREFNTFMGIQFGIRRVEAGSAKVTVNNQDGDYWPDNAASPHSPNVQTDVAIGLLAVLDSDVYYLWHGMLQAMDGRFLDQLRAAVLDFVATGTLRLAARYSLDNISFGSGVSGAYIANVLQNSDVGLDPQQIIGATRGDTTIKASGTLNDINAMAHLRDVTGSDGGYLFVDEQGLWTFHHRRFREETNQTALFTLGVGGIRYQGLQPQTTGQNRVNIARVTRDGGTQQEAINLDSRTKHGPRSRVEGGRLYLTDAEALEEAESLVGKQGDQSHRIKRVSVLLGQNDSLQDKKDLLRVTIGDRITVKHAGASIDHDYHVDQVRRILHGGRERFTMTTILQMRRASDTTEWILGRANFSELGATMSLARPRH